MLPGDRLRFPNLNTLLQLKPRIRRWWFGPIAMNMTKGPISCLTSQDPIAATPYGGLCWGNDLTRFLKASNAFARSLPSRLCLMVARAGTSTNRFWHLQIGCVQPPVMSSSDLRWSNLCLLAACLGCQADCRIESCFRPPPGGCRRQRRQMTRPWSGNKYAGTLVPPKRQTPHGELTVSLRAFFKSRLPCQVP